MNKINSIEYWDGRFGTRDWAFNGGPVQTAYFAKMFCDNVPEWFVSYVRDNQFSVLDLGCAEGEGTAALNNLWPGQVSGADFSEEAVNTATGKYPEYRFFTEDFTNFGMNVDILYLSNIMEHFPNPYDLVTRLVPNISSSVIVLVPFEESVPVSEHEFIFTYENIPINISDLHLVYCSAINEYPKEAPYKGEQILLIYSKDKQLFNRLSISSSFADVAHLVNSDDYRNFKTKYLAEKFKAEDFSNQLNNVSVQLNNSKLDNEELHSELCLVKNQAASLAETNANISSSLLSVQQESHNLRDELNLSRRIEAQLRAELDSAHQIEAQLRIGLEDAERNLEQAKSELQSCQSLVESTSNELAERNAAYDNLYTYSSNRDGVLSEITASKSYIIYTQYIRKAVHSIQRVLKKIGRTFGALFHLDFNTFLSELAAPFNRFFMKAQNRKAVNETFKTIENEIAGKDVIIFPPNLDWDMPLFQRPQQLAASYARKKDTVVIYLTINNQNDRVETALKIQDNLWLIYDGYSDRLIPMLKKARRSILTLNWTINKTYIEKLKPSLLIYEYIDELEIFYRYDEQMVIDHNELMKTANVTVCTATKLYNKALGIAANPILSPNAGDYDFFSKTKDYEISPLIADRISGYKCVLGYYGALAAWFDYELVKESAALHPEWVWLLIGLDYDGTIGNSGIEKNPNIIHIPPQPYLDLPHFMKAFDIATIPFVINGITLSTSPVKLFEYMAADKPIITSKMPECLKYESVMTYSNAKEFCSLVEKALSFESENDYWNVLRREALENTWDSRTDEILKAIE